VRVPVLEKFPNQPAIALSYFFRGHLAPLSRRPYQPENRFSSVSRPFLNVSGAASPLRRGALLRTAPRVPLARIYQTATIGPAGLYCWLDCACAGVGRRGVGSGMWLKGGEMNEVKTSERQRGRAREERIGSQMKTDTHRSEMRLWLIRAGSALTAPGAGQQKVLGCFEGCPATLRASD